MPVHPWRRRRIERGPELTGVWARTVATSTTVQRRTLALGTPTGEVGALLSRAATAAAAVRHEVDVLCAQGSARWPDADLQVPADPLGRDLHDRVRGLVAAQRAVLHRATLMTMPADATEQGVLLAGLRRAVGDLEVAARPAPTGPSGATPPGP